MTYNPPQKPFVQRIVERYLWNNTANSELRSYAPIGSYNSIFHPYTNLSKSGVSVTDKTALSIPAYFRAIKIIQDTIATFPWQVFKRTSTGKELAKNHYMYDILHLEASPLMSSSDFRKAIIGYAYHAGNGIARIIRGSDGKVKYFELWDDTLPVHITVNNGELWYVRGSGADKKNINAYHSSEIFHIKIITKNGYEGISLLDFAKDNLGNTISGQERSGDLHKTGAVISGVFHAGEGIKLNDDGRERVRDAFRKYTKGGKDAGGVLTLQDRESFTPINMTPKDSQFLESMNFSVKDVSRWTGVPLSLLSDMEGTQYNNMEHQDSQFLKYTLLPILVTFEQEAQRKIFNQDLDKNYFSEFNFDGLLRADSVARAESYQKYWSVGAISSNEIRSKENMNPVEGGNEYFVPLNHVPLSRTNDYIDSIVNKNTNNGEGN